MGKIFISYRRNDAPFATHQVYNKLASDFGYKAIFMDIYDIPIATDFMDCLDAALNECGVLVAIIGDDWLRLLRENQQTGKDDLVSLEIRTALERGIPLIPVLVERAIMPNETQLPHELHKLSRCNAEKLRSGRDLKPDLQALADTIEQWVPKAPETLPSSWEKRYLEALIRQCDDLKLDLIAKADQGESRNGVTTDQTETGKKVTISDVFTKLFLHFEQPTQFKKVVAALYGDVDEDDDEESVPIEAVEAAACLPRLVILGHPGGGKSALVNHLSLQLAQRRLTGDFDAGKMPGWDAGRNPLPVRVILRHFAAWLPETAPVGEEELISLIWQYLGKQLADLGNGEFYPTLQHELIHNGGIIFFDGLDEVSAADVRNKRATIVAAIKAFSEHLSQSECSIIITCREYAYQKDAAWRLDDQEFPVAKLPLFKIEQIESFIETWYDLFSPQQDENQQGGKDLIRTIREWQHLQNLAQYPLLLTLMALVHGRYKKLPEDRAHLYDLAVELLLEHWDNRTIDTEQGPVVERGGLVARLGFPTETLRAVLADVALAAHERQGSSGVGDADAADITWGELLKKLREPLKGDLNDADATIDYLQQRAGLLEARDNDTYAFPHRTFQEYLAAEHLCKDAEFVEMLRQRVFRDLHWWKEVFLLAAGISGNRTHRNSRATPGNIVLLTGSLLPMFEKRYVNRDHLDLALLASQAMWENKFEVAAKADSAPGLYIRALKEIQTWLVHSLAAEKNLGPPERAAAGASLARLGDPRDEVMSLEHIRFCYVPAGEYYARDNKTLVGVESYWISRYPVTHAQFKAFVNAGGYANAAYWKRAPSWRNNKYDNRTGPSEYGVPFKHPNHPAVGVSWHEAFAFTLWLTEKWLREGIIPPEHVVRLPTETEWEKAARGGLEIAERPHFWPTKNDRKKPIDMQPSCSVKQNHQPQRIYPWGGSDADTNLMNCKTTHIMATNAVGCFPGGVSPYGCEEMVGNVMEWCFDKWEGSHQEGYRVVRGGGFGHVDRLCNLTQRTNNAPHFRANDVGFRLVVSAQSRSDLVAEPVTLSLRDFIEFLRLFGYDIVVK